MSGEDARLQSYLPALLLRRLAERRDAALEPGATPFEAVVLFADVSGFTALTEKLAARGPIGAETLTGSLNACFGPLIAEIGRHAGEVVEFAGDALIALFVPDADEAPDTALYRAAACGLALAPTLAGAPDGATHGLRLRVGLAAGVLGSALLGGEADRWHHFVTGPAIAAAGVAGARVEPGEVGVDAASWERLRGRARGRAARDRVWVLETLEAGEPPKSFSERAAVSGVDVRAFLPEEVIAHFEAGQAEWLAEFRRVSVAFVSVLDLDLETPGALQRFQDAVVGVQRAVDRYDGRVKQLLMDDKGTVLIAAWGMPSTTHEDDALRAVEASWRIREALAGAGFGAGIGIATGRLFCGNRGSAVRREYALLGSAMNLAARLMSAAGDGVLCDGETARAAAGRVRFEALPPMVLKGKAEPVAVHRPLHREDRDADKDVASPPLVGRRDERAQLAARLRALGEGESGVLLLEGEPGIGKSQLLDFVEAEAHGLGLAVLRGDADAIEQSTAYYTWRNVFRQLFRGAAREGTAALRDAVAAELADAPRLLSRLPLLGALLPLELEEDAALADLDGRVRADQLRELAVHLLERAAHRRPTLLVLDDAHWFDSASWALLEAVVRGVRPLLVVVATRPLPEPAPAEADRILADPSAERLPVRPLAGSDVVELVARRLGVSALPTAVAEFVKTRAEGNPFFSEQLALALRDAGHLVVEDGRCRLADHASDLSALSLPHTVQGVITARIDRLPPAEQLTLKVASVIGRVFRYRVLSDVRPAGVDRQTLASHCERMVRLDLTLLERPDPDLAYLFKHVITREVAYELLAFAQRRELHRAVAEWYEQSQAADLDPFVPLLAHHWTQAEVPEKALLYLERAAEQALANHANEEVVRFMRQALALADESDTPVDAARRSRWEWHLAEAIHRLSRYAESEAHYEASLRLLGRPVPARRVVRALDIFVQLARQAWHRIRQPRPRDRAQTERARLLQAAHIHQRLAEVGYWKHDFVTLIHSTVASLNIAELAGPSKELQLAHQVMGFTAGLTTLHGWFRFYRTRAQAVAREIQHADTSAFCAELEAIYHNANGNWDAIEEAGLEGCRLFEGLGNRFRWQTCVILRAFGALHHGDLDRATALFREAKRMVGPEGAVQPRLWSVSGLLSIALARGEAGPDEQLAELESLLATGVDLSDAIMGHGLLARAYFERGDRDRAMAHVAAATPRIDRLPPASFHTLLGNSYVAEIHLQRWEESKTKRGPERREALHAIAGLRRFAAACRTAWPRVWLHRGRAAWLEGKPDRAREHWRRGLERARALDMPLEVTLLERALEGAAPSR